ncbi:hypothetical protein Pyn_33414 [Prunus yedoensis var. nudiflora]|uniref:Uncharacterized protein n=1 Tax=Prunus yedoensis var. nudiflora TaxID=2094558 RepID=A0A314Y722_PRUYE|nr:hypothetical protein Pyn_33414 [Prunus yedoensis var. nudiflora]
MAPKKDSDTVLDSSSSKVVPTSLPFISGVGVNEFAAIFDGLVERFADGRAQFLLCKDLINLLNINYILGPRYLEKKAYQLCNYEPHPIRACILVFPLEGID